MPGREQHEQVIRVRDEGLYRELSEKLEDPNKAREMTGGEQMIRKQEKALSITRERRERMAKDLHAMHDEVRRERDEMVKERELLLAQVEELNACISYAEMFMASKWYENQEADENPVESPKCMDR